jgi:sortase (surface protein transpeptidase)
MVGAGTVVLVMGCASASMAILGVQVANSTGPSTHAIATPRRQMPNPVRIVIPSIGVDARIVRLGLIPDQTMEVPRDLADVGWFAPGPEPGEQGPAVIVGHVNGRGGPGVFVRLWKLRAGAVIEVDLEDGSNVTFIAKSMLRVAKSEFPTARVYGRTSQPTLRLITCAGKLSHATGHHAQNRIVFAVLHSGRG